MVMIQQVLVAVVIELTFTIRSLCSGAHHVITPFCLGSFSLFSEKAQ